MSLVHASNINQNKFHSCKGLHVSTADRNRRSSFRLPRPADAATTETLMTRSDAPHRYAIRGGMEGKKRLDLLAHVLLPTTTELLNRVGLVGGMKCLDVGCGGGHVTILMARIVGPEGRVIGTDTDAEILGLARED